MATSEQLAVIIKDGEGNQNDAIMHYTLYSATDRAKRSITGLVGFWIAAAISRTSCWFLLFSLPALCWPFYDYE